MIDFWFSHTKVLVKFGLHVTRLTSCYWLEILNL